MGAITTICMVIMTVLTFKKYRTEKKILSELKKFNA